jgi:hypothetical protein
MGHVRALPVANEGDAHRTLGDHQLNDHHLYTLNTLRNRGLGNQREFGHHIFMSDGRGPQPAGKTFSPGSPNRG